VPGDFSRSAGDPFTLSDRSRKFHGMARYVVAVLILIALLAGIWWLMFSDQPPTTTLPQASTPTSTTAPVTTTSTSAPTSITSDNGHVVDTIEEAEEILRELWFGWFEGIYNQDEGRIREVVATEEQVDVAKEQFGVMEFTGPPTRTGIQFSETEILRSDGDCLAVWARVELRAFRQGASEVVHVIRRSGSRWVLLGLRFSREDLWELDCEVSLSSRP
jgi:hypothetical protein